MLLLLLANADDGGSVTALLSLSLLTVLVLGDIDAGMPGE